MHIKSSEVSHIKSFYSPRVQPGYMRRHLGHIAAFFRDVTSNPTLAQCNELSDKIQQLSGCEACTCEKIRQYFTNKKRNLARRTTTVLGVDTILLGVEEDSKQGILTPKEDFQVAAHAPAASGISREDSAAQNPEAYVQATNSVDAQRGPSGTHVPQYPSQACTAGTGGVPGTHIILCETLDA